MREENWGLFDSWCLKIKLVSNHLKFQSKLKPLTLKNISLKSKV